MRGHPGKAWPRPRVRLAEPHCLPTPASFSHERSQSSGARSRRTPQRSPNVVRSHSLERMPGFWVSLRSGASCVPSGTSGQLAALAIGGAAVLPVPHGCSETPWSSTRRRTVSAFSAGDSGSSAIKASAMASVLPDGPGPRSDPTPKRRAAASGRLTPGESSQGVARCRASSQSSQSAPHSAPLLDEIAVFLGDSRASSSPVAPIPTPDCLGGSRGVRA